MPCNRCGGFMSNKPLKTTMKFLRMWVRGVRNVSIKITISSRKSTLEYTNTLEHRYARNMFEQSMIRFRKRDCSRCIEFRRPGFGSTYSTNLRHVFTSRFHDFTSSPKTMPRFKRWHHIAQFVKCWQISIETFLKQC